MATRSTIALSVPDGVRAIYCHWDGYPEGVGQTLKDHYNKLLLISELLDRGDVSSLGDTLVESVFYEDRGEDTPAHKFASESEWLDWATNCGCEYAYLYRGDAWIAEAI